MWFLQILRALFPIIKTKLSVVYHKFSVNSYFAQGRPLSFLMSATLAGISGLAGGFVGNPGDLVNVRMQNDLKLPKDQRRKYVPK